MSAEMPKMPEPIRAFAEFANAEGHDIAYTYDTDRSRWLFLNPMTADLWRYWQEAARQAMEQFERQVSEWMHVPTLKLRAGEMTAQEVRTVIGVLGAIRALIPHDPDHLAGVGNMVDGKDQSEERHG